MDLAPAPQVARKRIESLSDGSLMRVRKMDIIVLGGEIEERRRAEDGMQQKASAYSATATENSTFDCVFLLSSVGSNRSKRRTAYCETGGYAEVLTFLGDWCFFCGRGAWWFVSCHIGVLLVKGKKTEKQQHVEASVL
jgi:hypothetical protein